MKNILIAISLAAAASSGALTVAACAGAIKGIPADITLAECITDGALKKEPIKQIADECKTDIPGVISALFGSKNSEIPSTPAYGEARRTLSISLPPDASK